MKNKGQGKKDYVVVIKEEDGTRRVFSRPVTIGQASFLVRGSSLPLDFFAIRHLEQLGIKPHATTLEATA
jgi:hypothetical protein